MTEDDVRSKIVEIVKSKAGIKLMELIACLPLEASKFDIVNIVENLAVDKKILEVNYTLPDMPYRIKTFLLPGGSELV